MWTLATLLSIQFRYLQESLYQDTKQILESLSLSNNGQDSVDSEQVQAWILIATFESMRTLHQEAWMSAGRAFRLVQIMRLHEIDLPNQDALPRANNHKTDLIETEERRRIFWMAYLLDHLLSMRNSWPVTLTEHMVCVLISL
jgi:hypothetical protein